MTQKRTHYLVVGLLGLALLAWPALAEQTPGFGVGLRGGAVLAQTDLAGKIGPGGGLFLRHGLTPRFTLELSGGYGQMVTEDSLWWDKTLAPAARMLAGVWSSGSTDIPPVTATISAPS